MKKKIITGISIVTLVFILIFSFKLIGKKYNAEVFLNNNIKLSTKVIDNSFQIYKDGIWHNMIVKGVNMKDTKLGNTMISKEDYRRWFSQIGEMNANAIRVDSIQHPDFYKEFKRYNEKVENKLYIFQGVPFDENNLDENLDPFKLDSILPFKEEIKNAIDVIHGNKTLSDGHLQNKYTADISPYVIGWILGTKWSPNMIDSTNTNRLDKVDYNGNYVYTTDAKPFEIWLGDIMDHTLTYEMEQYSWQRPISFVNHVITDMIKQSFEPIKENDLAGINPNTIRLKNIETGYFASYNIYPYYPNFLNLDPRYTNYIDHRGKPNNFAGYLNQLKSLHEIPIMVSEFGVPSSRGMENINIHGWSEGFLTEEEQGNIIVSLFDDIIEEDYLGGIIWAWQDQWTSPLWSDAQNPKEHFGLLSFDRHKISVDGDIKDWKNNKSNAVFTSEKNNLDKIKSIYMDYDEKYLYIAMEYKDLDSLDTLIFLDTVPSQGNTTNPYNSHITTNNGAEFIVYIGNQDKSRILVDSYYDFHYFKYGKTLQMIDNNLLYEDNNSGIYNPIKLINNEEMTIHNTKQKIALGDYETGILKKGNGNSNAVNYDSLADYYINTKNNIMELRIPWSMLGFTNPSTKEIIGNLYINGFDSRINIGGINIAIAVYDPEEADKYDYFPRTEAQESPNEMFLYTWDNWDSPITNERLKKSYYIVKDRFKDY